MPTPEFSIPGAIAHGLMAAGLAAALAWPATATADELFNRDTLLQDDRVRAAMKVLRYYPSLDKPEPAAFDDACWKAAAAQKTNKTQFAACLSAAAKLLGTDSRFVPIEDTRSPSAGPENFAGIGLRFAQATEGLDVTDIFPEGPAYRAGVTVGDRLTHADGTSLTGLSIDLVLGLLRGKPGSRVRLDTVSKTGARRSVDVERAGISWPGEFARPIPGGWYLQLQSMSPGSAARVRTLIRQAHARGELAGTLVLDLRGNGGGAAHFVVDLARVLLHRDDIQMSTLSMTGTDYDSVGGYNYEGESQTGEPYKQAQVALQAMPLVVLTDERTASGSTWLLATLRAHRNTYTMGTATSTSATVLQQLNAYGGGKDLFELPKGYLYADGGEALHGKGIAPDVLMPSEPPTSGEPPSWLQAALTTHEARLRLPRQAAAVAPGGASASSETRQCLGPMSVVSGAAPRWVRVDEDDNQIRLGDTTLFVLEQSRDEYHAMQKQRTESIHAERAALIQQANERIAKLSRKRGSTDDEKQFLKKLQALLERLRHPPGEDVAGHPSATLLTRFDLINDATGELSWWYDGVAYVLQRRLEDGHDGRSLTSWLDLFQRGAPSLPDTSPSLCLPNARLTLPPDVGFVEGRIRFKLAATGDSTWVMGFSDSSGDSPISMHDKWMLASRHQPYSTLQVSPRCREHGRLRPRPPSAESIAGRPGISVQLDGLTCGLTRAAMLPVLGKKDPWNLVFGLAHPTGEPANTGLDAWRQALDTVRWGPLPVR